MRRINKPWGYELLWAENPRYLGKILCVMAGKRLSLQYHKVKDETMFVQKGNAILEYGEKPTELKSVELGPGQTWHIPAGMVHRLKAVTDIEVVEVSTSEIADVVRLEDDYGRGKNSDTV